MKKAIALLLIPLILFITAEAESLMVEGSVVSIQEERIVAPYAGKVLTLMFREGDFVTAGMEAATLEPMFVRAPFPGTVILFADTGDTTAEIELLYGAVAYLVPDASFSLAVDITPKQGVVVQTGDIIWLRCQSPCMHTGTGVITEIDGVRHSVLVTDGDFLAGEAVNIYQNVELTEESCIGSSILHRIAAIPLDCKDGIVVSTHISTGAHVDAGDEICEVAPTWDAHFVMHNESGVVSELLVQEGDTVEAGETIATVWPYYAMRIAAKIPEECILAYPVGASVHISFNCGLECAGVVEWVSMTPDNDSNCAAWTAYISFTPDEQVYYGMTATVQIP